MNSGFFSNNTYKSKENYEKVNIDHNALGNLFNTVIESKESHHMANLATDTMKHLGFVPDQGIPAQVRSQVFDRKNMSSRFTMPRFGFERNFRAEAEQSFSQYKGLCELNESQMRSVLKTCKSWQIDIPDYIDYYYRNANSINFEKDAVLLSTILAKRFFEVVGKVAIGTWDETDDIRKITSAARNLCNCINININLIRNISVHEISSGSEASKNENIDFIRARFKTVIMPLLYAFKKSDNIKIKIATKNRSYESILRKEGFVENLISFGRIEVYKSCTQELENLPLSVIDNILFKTKS